MPFGMLLRITNPIASIMKSIISIILLTIISFGCFNNVNEENSIEIIAEEKLQDHETVVVTDYNFEEFKYSEKCFGWKNPTTGGALHINKNDEIELYQSFRWISSKDTGYFKKISIDDDFHLAINGVGLGNAPSVLLTSEIEISESVSFEKIIDELKEGSYRVYIIK